MRIFLIALFSFQIPNLRSENKKKIKKITTNKAKVAFSGCLIISDYWIDVLLTPKRNKYIIKFKKRHLMEYNQVLIKII